MNCPFSEFSDTVLFVEFNVIIKILSFFVNEEKAKLDVIETTCYAETDVSQRRELKSMNNQWESAIITKIALAIHVSPDSGTTIHNNRPFHGLVINDSDSVNDYLFSDGTILHTKENEVFYLPKGSSYRVTSSAPGGCYAINFDLAEPLSDLPFTIPFRNSDTIRRSFHDAAVLWKQRPPYYQTHILKELYHIIALTGSENSREYMSGTHDLLIAPAVTEIKRNFTNPDLTISKLADLCGISEVYFRALFSRRFGMSPKEYIIRQRIRHARQLLESGQFSVNETAGLCGFAEPCHFSREFKKYVGISPKQYSKSPAAWY